MEPSFPIRDDVVGLGKAGELVVKSGLISGGAYTFATLPSASSVSPGTSAYTTDTGLLISDGASWLRDLTPKTISTTTYTLLAADRGRRLIFTSGSAVTVTIPSSLVAGYEVTIEQGGAGQISLTGTTINNVSSHTKTSGQYAVVALLGGAVDVYTLTGSTGT